MRKTNRSVSAGLVESISPPDRTAVAVFCSSLASVTLARQLEPIGLPIIALALLSLLLIVLRVRPLVSLLVAGVTSTASAGVWDMTLYLSIPAVVFIWGQAASKSARIYSEQSGKVVRFGIGSLLTIVALNLINMLPAVDPNVDLLMQVSFVALIGWCVFAWAMHVGVRRSDLRIALSALAATASVYLFQAAPSVASGGPNSWADRPIGAGWENPNTLGFIFAIGAVWALYELSERIKSLDAVCASILVLGTGFTFSRAAYVALAVGTLLVITRKLSAAIIGCTAVTLVLFNLPSAVEQRIFFTTSSGKLDDSSSVRLSLWRTAWNLAVDNPILGVGIHSLGERFALHGYGEGLLFAHNIFLTLFASCGLVVPFLVIYLGLRQLGRIATSRARLLSLGSCLGAGSMFGEQLLAPAIITLIAVMIATMLHYGGSDEDGEKASHSTNMRHSGRGDMVHTSGQTTN